MAQEDQVELLVVLPRKIDEAGPEYRCVVPQFQVLYLILNHAPGDLALVEHVDFLVLIGPKLKESTVAAARIQHSALPEARVLGHDVLEESQLTRVAQGRVLQLKLVHVGRHC